MEATQTLLTHFKISNFAASIVFHYTHCKGRSRWRRRKSRGQCYSCGRILNRCVLPLFHGTQGGAPRGAGGGDASAVRTADTTTLLQLL